MSDLAAMTAVQFATIPPNPRVIEMRRHFDETGGYRPEDLLWLLGDPARGVSIGPTTTVAEAFRDHRK